MVGSTVLKCFGAVSMLACAAASPAMADAIITIDSSKNSLPADPGFTPIDLSGAPSTPYSGAPIVTGMETISFVGISNGQGIVNGASNGLYAAPVTGSSGATYAGNYFSTGGQGYIDIAFASPEMALALLWGSVDTSNEITFLSNGVAIGTVLGSQITSNANGNQGYGGSFYTLLNLNQSFNEIRLSSGIVSFEAAEFEVDQSNFISEPASLALLVLGLGSVTLLRRRFS